jgi:hypothetical protein
MYSPLAFVWEKAVAEAMRSAIAKWFIIVE